MRPPVRFRDVMRRQHRQAAVPLGHFAWLSGRSNSAGSGRRPGSTAWHIRLAFGLDWWLKRRCACSRGIAALCRNGDRKSKPGGTDQASATFVAGGFSISCSAIVTSFFLWPFSTVTFHASLRNRETRLDRIEFRYGQ